MIDELAEAANLRPYETSLLARSRIAQHILNDMPAIVLWEDLPQLSEAAFYELTEEIERYARQMLQSVRSSNPEIDEIERRARG